MRILFVADARSPIASGWISHFVEGGHEIHVLSTYPCRSNAVPGAVVHQCPIAFAGFLGAPDGDGAKAHLTRVAALKGNLASLRNGKLSGLSLAARFWLAPFGLRRNSQKVRDLISQIAPDLVHAMRIPFEGMLAARGTPPEVPLLVSIWGNDLTLFGSRYPLISRETKRVLMRADALHCDCHRDLKLAIRSWGFRDENATLVLPSSGGIKTALFGLGESDSALRAQLDIADGAPVVFNPRGVRGYVRNDVFFKAIPLVLEQQPEAVFVCAGMHSNPSIEKWVRKFAIQKSVRLLPSVPRDQMAELFRLASVAVSPSLHDGTPNTLLEAMACGCFPVAGDIESVREWITDQKNGLLCDPTDPDSLARAMFEALADKELRQRARELNVQLIADRAEYPKVMQQAEEFYSEVVRRHRAGTHG